MTARNRTPLVERIDAILAECPAGIRYFHLAERLWDHRSKAFRNAVQGGPPGCYMALSAALRRGEFPIAHEKDTWGCRRLVMPRKKK